MEKEISKAVKVLEGFGFKRLYDGYMVKKEGKSYFFADIFLDDEMNIDVKIVEMSEKEAIGGSINFLKFPEYVDTTNGSALTLIEYLSR